jgi:hypothetical protein
MPFSGSGENLTQLGLSEWLKSENHRYLQRFWEMGQNRGGRGRRRM